MRKYKAVVTISREDDTVHTRIKLKNGERLDANMLIAFEFLNAVLNGAEETGVLVKPFKKMYQRHAERLRGCGCEREI